ncbi:MAG: gliding motility-associated C-terminal domain-containing protein [Bacteroidia bacterium]|nr:gliding motility-associated C-terminal domain-containing protein [Bacteroidia bacterium]
MEIKKIILILACFGLCLSSQAKHLVGGDMEYTCLGKDQQGFNLYQITLNVYRDCQPTIDFPTNTPFDPEIAIQIYNALNNSLETEIIIALTDTLVLPLTGSDSCVAPPANLCYARGTYTTTIRLRDNTSGYELVWGRCCRNETIQNILQPGEFGMAINTRIPNTALCNSSPSFTNQLPTYICRSDLFSFDHSATDADGDELTYDIVTPFTAGSQMDPVPVVPPPPFLPIAWLPGYGLSNVMDGSPALRVDQQTGVLTVSPQNLGQYVFSLRVTERRNGQVIGVIRRDIQVNVIDCPINFPPNIQLPDTDLISGDTLFFERDQESCFSFIVSDQNGPGIGSDSISFRFDGPHLALPDPGDIQVQSIGIDSLLVQFCWAPGCDFIDFPLNSLIFEVEDQNDCPAPNRIRDTIYFQTIAPELIMPEFNCVQVIDNQTIQLDWVGLTADQQNGFSYFSISRDDGAGFVEIAQIANPIANSFVDISANNADQLNYCYQLEIFYECPNLESGPPSLTFCSEPATGAGICAVSASNGAIEISWRENLGSSFRAYRVYKVVNGNSQLVEEIFDPMVTTWIDTEAIDAAESYCYELGLLSACDQEVLTGQHCSIPLEATDDELEITINWGDYAGWVDGISNYVIWRRTADSDTILGNLAPGLNLEWIDRDISLEQGGLYCYRIQAIPENQDSCRSEAWSLEQCISFEPSVFAANAFTPNGDGINDLFEIKGSFFSRFQLRIYNRWGNEIFVTDNIDQAWDGTNSGRPAPEGVYVYMVEYEDFSGNVFQSSGSITLIR